VKESINKQTNQHRPTYKRESEEKGKVIRIKNVLRRRKNKVV
jgi:hypothetical protein